MYSYIVKSACKGNHSGRPHLHFVPGFRFLFVGVFRTEFSGDRVSYFGGKRKLGQNNAYLEISHSGLYVPK